MILRQRPQLGRALRRIHHLQIVAGALGLGEFQPGERQFHVGAILAGRILLEIIAEFPCRDGVLLKRVMGRAGKIRGVFALELLA